MISQKEFDDAMSDLAAAEAENEQMRAALQACRNTAQINLKVAQDRGAENERLRTEIVHRDGVIRHRDARCDRIEAENTRLRALLSELLPDIERLEFVESCTTDGNTPRLQMLRRALGEIRAK